MPGDIPLSVIVVTRNEAHNLPRCLHSLKDFDEIIVVDSASSDNSAEIASAIGASVVPYEWDGRYPKKRQWCLDTLSLRHDRVFFVDADEVVTQAMVDEIRALRWKHDGYFVRGAYVFEEKILRFGLMNNKLALFDRRAFSYPVVDDLAVRGMGEIEGHYQPVPIRKGVRVGQLRHALLHYAGDGGPHWRARHEDYAVWEAFMLRHHAYPQEIGMFRAVSKFLFRHLPLRPAMAFVHSYVLKGGFIEGARGFRFARSRYTYYRMVNDALSFSSTKMVPENESPTVPIEARK